MLPLIPIPRIQRRPLHRKPIRHRNRRRQHPNDIPNLHHRPHPTRISHRNTQPRHPTRAHAHAGRHTTGLTAHPRLVARKFRVLGDIFVPSCSDQLSVWSPWEFELAASAGAVFDDVEGDAAGGFAGWSFDVFEEDYDVGVLLYAAGFSQVGGGG